MNKRAVVVLSGGLDSATLAYCMMIKGWKIKALTVNYGQRHVKEIDAAKHLCEKHLEIRHEVVDIRSITKLLGGSSLTDSDVPVPQGHYEAESMKKTVVPNRNMIFLSIAAAWAISDKCDVVAYAAHAGDHIIYKDCRPEFASAVNTAILLADEHPVELFRPFIQMTKADIIRAGAELSVPFEDTWSCYEGGEKHCGKCGTCVERKLAFEEAGVDDPTEYEN